MPFASLIDGPGRSFSAHLARDDGDFIREIADSGCTTTVECMKGPGNPYRDSDPKSLTFEADCAKWVYMMRAYYAWKNSLPFSYVSDISGHGDDYRFTSGNRIVSRRDLVDRGEGLAAPGLLNDIHEQVSSATYRTDAAQADGVLPDFYSPKIQPGSIRAGTVLYDINGHVAIVYAVEAGRACALHFRLARHGREPRDLWRPVRPGPGRTGGRLQEFPPREAGGRHLAEWRLCWGPYYRRAQ